LKQIEAADKKLTQIDPLLAVEIGKDICSGMAHLHAENILHCDLAARNLLVSLKGKDQYVIKVADFGLSHISESDNYNLKAEAKFPIRWSAPEVMTRGQVSKPADVWSFGVVIWEIVEWEKPYHQIESNTDVMRKVCNAGMRLEKPSRIPFPEKLWKIVLSCWDADPKARPSFQELYMKLGELEAAIGRTQSSKSILVAQGGQYNYARSSGDAQQNYTRSPLEKGQSSLLKNENKKGDEGTYLQSPVAAQKPKVEEGIYNQTPAKIHSNLSSGDADTYKQTPTLIPEENNTGNNSLKDCEPL